MKRQQVVEQPDIELQADFHFVDDDGLLAARAVGVSFDLAPGQPVRITDGQGNHIRGIVVKLLARVVLVRPYWQTWPADVVTSEQSSYALTA